MNLLKPGEGDLVLIYFQDNPSVYARIESIEADVKKDWYRVNFLFLTIPASKVTWILRESYIEGTPFTMGGEPVRLEPVPGPGVLNQAEADKGPGPASKNSGPGKVIPFKKG